MRMQVTFKTPDALDDAAKEFGEREARKKFPPDLADEETIRVIAEELVETAKDVANILSCITKGRSP